MEARAVGRYLLCEEVASGGMASVFLGLQRGDEGFRRAVAIKRLHAQFAKDPDFASALVDEGRMQARVHHPNVASALDVVRSGDDLLLVMEYVHGASLHELVRACRTSGLWPSVPVLGALVVGTLRGLHAAHEARSTNGAPLEIVHRDVSPQNILVGVEGVPRVVDFGIAHAAERLQITREGTIKGKPGYMAPEQIRGEKPSRTADVYAAGVVLWELLTHERLFPGGDFMVVARSVLEAHVDPPSAVMPSIPPGFDELVGRAIHRDAGERFPTAAAFADGIEALGPIASAAEVALWVTRTAPELVSRRAALLDRVERGEVAETGPGASSMRATRTEVDGPRSSMTNVDEPRVETASSAILPARGSSTPPRRVGMFVAIGAGLLVAGIASGLALGRTGPASSSSSLASATRPVETASSTPPVVPTTEPTVVPSPPSLPALPSAPSAVVTASASAVADAPHGSAAAKPPRGGHPPSEACVTVGADGIKHWNPRCK